MTDRKEMSNLEKIAKIWQLQLNLEYENKERNVRLSFKDIGAITEFLALERVTGFVGSGSGGSGFDLVNHQTKKAIEVKSCCTIQGAQCNKCKTKFNNLFIDSCPNCNSTSYAIVNDSRFGINAEELIMEVNAGLFECFIMCYIHLLGHNKENGELHIKMDWFKVKFSEDDEDLRKSQMDYFLNQFNNGRKPHNNLLPESYDFYKLAPVKIAEQKITLNYKDINKTPLIEENYQEGKVRAREEILYKAEMELFRNLQTYDAETHSADVVDFSKHMPYRNKSLGKERGDTVSGKFAKLKGSN